MAVARSLVVDIAMNTAKITKDIEKVRTSFDKIGSTANKIGGILVAAFSVRAILNYTNHLIDLGDELNKTSQKIGISVEKLSAFEYSARLSGNSSEELKAALARLANNMQDAAINKTSEAARTFNTLGIEITDTSGRLKDTGTVFESLSAKFAAAADGPNKTAAAISLMGRSGAELIPLLNNLRDTADEAQRTGNIISKDFAEASERFNDSVERTSSAFGNLARAGIANVLPLLNSYIEKLNVAIGAQDGLSLSALEFERAKLAQAYLGAAEMAKLWGWDVEKNTESIRKQIDAIDDQIIALNKAQQARQGTAPKQQLQLPEITKPKSEGGKSPRSEMEDAIRAEMEISEGLTREGITRTTELIIAEEEARRLRRIEIIRGSILDEDTLRQEEFDRRLEQIQVAYEQEIISMEDRNRLIEQMQLEHEAALGDITSQGILQRQQFDKMSMQQQAATIFSTLEGITQGVANHNKALFKINKAAAIGTALINTYQGVTKALSAYPPPLSFVMAAAQLAAGMASVNAIKSASFGTATSAPSIGAGGAIPVTDVGASGQPRIGTESQRPSQNITINVQNGMGNSAYWQNMIDEVIVPGINDASERNVNLNIRTV